MAPTIFVGREREQQLYAEFLSNPTPWICTITGQGGIGKTTLLRRLARRTPSTIPVVMLDFGNETLRTDALHILKKLASKTAKYCNKRQVKRFLDASDATHAEITDVNKITRRAQNSSRRVTSESASISDSDRARMSALAAREAHHQIRERVTEAFFKQIDTFQPAHLVLMFDTYEWFNEPQYLELGQWMTHQFIVDLQERLQARQRHCSIVIASRVPPVLEGISRQDQWHADLDMLDQRGVEDYLKRLGISDPALQQEAFSITHGHALSVSILGALWKEQEEQGEQSLTQADFPKLQDDFNERARFEFIIK